MYELVNIYTYFVLAVICGAIGGCVGGIIGYALGRLFKAVRVKLEEK
ncbi:MAG: hypothetical protein J7M24_00170 [Candidatus Latescibacteria bacterium]|nr:hypothetical protein [Candidatus Latescibacterota bacterium]